MPVTSMADVILDANVDPFDSGTLIFFALVVGIANSKTQHKLVSLFALLAVYSAVYSLQHKLRVLVDAGRVIII